MFLWQGMDCDMRHNSRPCNFLACNFFLINQMNTIVLHDWTVVIGNRIIDEHNRNDLTSTTTNIQNRWSRLL